MYRRRFSIYFSPTSSSYEEVGDEGGKEATKVRRVGVDGGSYEPTIVCYNMRDDVLEVRTSH